MAVSSVLIPGDPASAFSRQQAGVTSSVRLRKRRDDLTAPGRKKERHSGDFSFIRASENDVRGAVVPCTRGKDLSPCTNRGREVDHSAKRREADPILRVSLQCSRAVSTSAVNLRETQASRGQRQSGDFSQVQQWGQRALREGKLRPTVPSSHEEVKPRLRPRQEEEAKLRVTPVYQDKPKLRHQPHSHESAVRLRVKPRGEVSCPHRRQSSYQPELLSAAAAHRESREANSKRCSGEFEFRAVRRRSQEWLHSSLAVCENLGKTEEQSFTHEMVMRELSGAGDTGSEGSEESGIFSTGSSQESPSKPRPGLGRRALTQVDLKERKNSYNSALARSQENLVTVSPEVGEPDLTLKKGLLWQQRDKLFSRWKERYFILTRDLLQCFKKGTSRITEMGEFIFSIKLPEVEAIELLDKRGYLTICINLQREGKVYLRRTEGIRDWYNAIRDSMEESKVRRNNRASAIFADRRQNTDCSGMDGFVAGRRLGRLGAFSDSTPEVNKGDKERITLDELSRLYRREEEEEERKQEADAKMNRLSMMSCEEHGGELDLEKGVFLRRREADSGNNSLQSSTGTASSKLSQPRECNSFLEEDEADFEQERPSPEVRIKRPAANTNIIEVRYRERNPARGTGRQHGGGEQERRKSRHVNRLQITNV